MPLNQKTKDRIRSSRYGDGIVKQYARAAVQFFRTYSQELGLYDSKDFEIVAISSLSKEHEYRSNDYSKTIIFDSAYCERLKWLYTGRMFFESPTIMYFRVCEIFSEILFTHGNQNLALGLSTFSKYTQRGYELSQEDIKSFPKIYRTFNSPKLDFTKFQTDFASILAHFLIGHEVGHHILEVEHPLSNMLINAAAFGVSSQYTFSLEYDHTSSFEIGKNGKSINYKTENNKNIIASTFIKNGETHITPSYDNVLETACDLFSFLTCFSRKKNSKSDYDSFKQVFVYLEILDVFKGLSKQATDIQNKRIIHFSYPKFLHRIRSLFFALRCIQINPHDYLKKFPKACELIAFIDVNKEQTALEILEINKVHYSAREPLFDKKFISSFDNHPTQDKYKVFLKDLERMKFSDDNFFKNYRLFKLSDLHEYYSSLDIAIYFTISHFIELCVNTDKAEEMNWVLNNVERDNMRSLFEYFREPSRRVFEYPFYPIDVPNMLKTYDTKPIFGTWDEILEKEKNTKHNNGYK